MTARLGVSLPQFTDDPDRFVQAVRVAEAAGLDSAWVFDHLWPLGGNKERPILECWSALANAAARTRDLMVGTLVTRSSLRNFAVLAKMAATVDSITEGRFTMGLGSGDEANRVENEAFGIGFLEGDARLSQLAGTLHAMRSFWDAHPVGGASSDHPTIWLGGRTSGLLRLAGELADGWNGWGGTPERFAEDARAVREAAGGREVAVTWAGSVVIGNDDEEAMRLLGKRDPKQHLVGSPERVAEGLAAFAAAGAEHIVCVLPHPTTDSYELLGGAVRERLGNP